MTTRTWLLTLFSLLLVGACLSLPFIPRSVPPFETQSLFSEGAIEIKPSSLGVPLPAGLQAGDRLYFEDMNEATRLAFVASIGNPPAGTVFDLRVVRDGTKHDVQVQFVEAPATLVNLTVNLALSALTALVAALGLLMLWRGENRATLGVALWCFGGVVSTILARLPVLMPYAPILGWAGIILDSVATLVGLYLVASGLTADAMQVQTSRRWRNGFSIMLALYAACVFTDNAYMYETGHISAATVSLMFSLHLVTFTIPLGMLVFGYRFATPVNKARIRWVLLSLTGLVLAYILGIVATFLGLSIITGTLLLTLLYAAAFTGFAYAVLKHRLVSLEFVLNRALVYGLITSLVVGVFAALLSLLERTALSNETNRFLALAIPLLLGMGLNAIKRFVDGHINRLFFRHRHRAEAELTQFARTCAFIDAPERLLDLTADGFHQHSGAQSLAIYLTQSGTSGAKLTRQRGTAVYPKRLDTNDPAFLQLRAGDAEVDLHGIKSALGADGYVYALAVRGEVLGIIVCGPRPGEAYTPEERRLYALVSHQAGVTLHALRLQEQQQLLRDLADGAFKSLPTARTRAKALLMPKAAG